MRKRTLAIFAVGALLVGAAAFGSPAGSTLGTEETWTVRVDKWKLLRSSGAELYQDLCASCHGAVGAGSRPAVVSGAVPAPRLDELRKAGVDKQHWTYVIGAPYEDSHHWAADGTPTCPPLNHIFRQALGNQPATMLITKKLSDYLDEVQQ